MEFVLLAGLLLADVPTSESPPSVDWTEIVQQVRRARQRLLEGEIDVAQKVADGVLRTYRPPRPGDKGYLKLALTGALVLRGECHLARGDAAEALADFDAVLAVDPNNLRALRHRVGALEKLGRHELAQQERRRYWQTIQAMLTEVKKRLNNRARHLVFGWLLRYGFLPNDKGRTNPITATLSVGTWSWTWDLRSAAGRAAAYTTAGSLLVTLAWLLMAVGNCFVALWQRTLGRGTWRRLVGVSAAIATMQVSPWVALVLLMGLAPNAADLSSLAAATVTVLSCSWMAFLGWLMPPPTFFSVPGRASLLEDETVLERVANMARRLGTHPPVVRVVRTLSPDLTIQAQAGGLVAPTIVIYDGVLHRLAPRERDSVLAHELAHFANKSIWVYAAVMSVTGIAMVLATAFLHLPTLMMGLIFFFGLIFCVSRYFEFDCDRRAAEVVGFGEVSTALRKVYAASLWRHLPPLADVAFGSLSSHPSRDQRLAALRSAAPDPEKPPIVWDEQMLRRRRMASRVAFAAWFYALFVMVVIAGDIWIPGSFAMRLLVAAPLIVILVALLVGLFAGLLALCRVKRRTTSRWDAGSAAGNLGVALMLIGWVAVFLSTLVESMLGRSQGPAAESVIVFGGVGGVVMLLGFAFWLVSALWTRRLDRRMRAAAHQHDFLRVVELAEAHPRLVAKRPRLRHNLALARALSGNAPPAIEELERLVTDVPRHKLAWQTLADLHLERGNAERALSLARWALGHSRRGINPHLVSAQALVQLNRLEEAGDAVSQALERIPNDGLSRAIAAQVALRQGDRQDALRQNSLAEEWEPGHPFVRLVEAEIALRTLDSGAALGAALEALSASTKNPFALVYNRAAEHLRKIPEEESPP